MSESTIETMLNRIEHLERANRAMKIIAIGAILGCIALNAVPAISSVFPHGPKQVDAESFNLVSSKGVLLATLGQGVNGGYLAFFDPKGKPEMQVGTSAGAPNKFIGMATFDGNALFPGTGNARQVWAMSTTNSTTTIGDFIFDASGNVRLLNSTAGDGSNAGSFFYDGNPLNQSHPRAGIGLGNNGPGAFFEDSTGASRLLEGVSSDDSATSFAMLNASGDLNHPLVDLSALGNGSDTALQIEDGGGVQRAIAAFSTGSQEIIQLHDGAGTETFRAPCTGASCP